ncbi:hypothetical protein KV112_08285 [Mycolicibacter sp. MYC123]|uniref:Uncharacterized protein n=1 Tax=[Mycobacterium] zoologicum TaxID=2872311 RepID=A0ABU5YI56_9MYCO|nr:tetratricopeptide repeat protein [Mycolicibacter sp. MYC123]MEB3049731.1 hypothetical protein [Mycolicibacter sp. MYC123]
MIGKDAVAQALREALMWLSARLRPSSPRLRLRTRLYLVSAPVIVVLLLLAAKLIGVGLVSNSAVTDFTRHDIEALRGDVAFLQKFDVFDPAKTAFAAGDLSVLEGRLQDADDRFSDSLARIGAEKSCPVRINLVLVRETLGDLATRAGKKDEAEGYYSDAMMLAQQAPADCFEGNSDPNEDRQAIRADSVPRLQRKIDALHRPPESNSPPPSTVAPDPPPTSLTPTSVPPLPGLAPTESSPDSTEGPGPAKPSETPVPGPGANMPDLPQSSGGQGPVIGPDEGGAPNDGPGVIDPISPDRIPTAGSGSPPGHKLGPGTSGDRLRRLLDNSNAYGDNREMPAD